MKHFLFLLFIATACTSAQINSAIKTAGSILNEESLTTEEVGQGLKEALINGISKGSDTASKLDGYFKNPSIKIPFPPEIQKVEDKLRQLGMNKLVDDFVLSVNRGAELAAKESKPIFVTAIKSLTIQDAWGILKGEDNAATQYLQKTTTGQLTETFNPIIKQSLDQVNATKHYSDIINTYNKIPFVEKVNPNLDEYVTGRAIDGLFFLVAKEEKNIREDPVARTSDLLKKVFSQQDK
ncbi:MAG: DUF4197 domain-containing protein [Cyclobacteriaceae bacterium]|nr:DUF4197 domain-containing protein [Cyclobacteriaceae bacterium]